MTERTPESRAGFLLRKRLEAERERQQRPHVLEQVAQQKACDHAAGGELCAIKIRSGALSFYDRCRDCGKTLQSYKHDAIPSPEDVPIERDDTYCNPPCAVCGTFGTELHHWAPREFFDYEADAWPTSWLCVECHARWHNTMRRAVPYKQRQQTNLANARPLEGPRLPTIGTNRQQPQ